MPVSTVHIVEALSQLGGEAHLDAIVARVREIAPKPLPQSVRPIIRARIQERCKEAESYRPGYPVLFDSVYGVAKRRGVWRLKHDALGSANPDLLLDPAEDEDGQVEGRAVLRIHLRRERSKKLVADFKANLSSFECRACGFDFERAYGAMGAQFIEAHHIVPVASLEEGARTRIADLVPLCANCHRMTHRAGLISLVELKGALRLAKQRSAAD